MNNYPHHIGDFLRDTVGLSMTEECVYRRLLDQYYAREGPLPDDVSELCRLARAMTPTEKRAVAYVVGRFFVKTSDGVSQKRADAELQKFRERSEKARESIAHRWHPDTNVIRPNAVAGRELAREHVVASLARPLELVHLRDRQRVVARAVRVRRDLQVLVRSEAVLAA